MRIRAAEAIAPTTSARWVWAADENRMRTLLTQVTSLDWAVDRRRSSAGLDGRAVRGAHQARPFALPDIFRSFSAARSER